MPDETDTLPNGAIEAEEWQEGGTRLLTGNRHGPFGLYAYQYASGAFPVEWEAILAHGDEAEAFDAAGMRQLAEHAKAAADELAELTRLDTPG
jgi:hypothetical protein